MHGVRRSHFTLVYSIAALFSILFSLWAAIKTSVINPDGICYLYSAAAMERFTIALHLCDQAKWPFYSILIFGFTKLTHLSFTVSAYFLDGFFSLISIITFIAIVNTLTHKIRIVVLAAIVILLAHEFNSLRTEIIRDHGFWAFYLLSLFFVLQYFMGSARKFSQQKKYYQWCYALLWNMSLIIAALFRIEGILFLLLLPFAVFADIRQTPMMRIKMFLQLNIMTCLGAIALFLWIILHPQQPLGRLAEVQFQLMHGINEFVQAFRQTTQALATHVLSVYSARDASWIMIGMLVSWYIFSVISNISLIYAALIIYAWWKKLADFSRETQGVLWAYILINVLITTIFLVDNLFLAKRYLIALSLVLMLWVPFTLDYLITERYTRKWPLLLAVILMIVYGLGGIFDFGHSKKYIRDGGDWLAMHATAQQKIYSNDYQILYYSNHFGNEIFSLGQEFQHLNTIAKGKWRQYDYLALHVSKNELAQNTAILHEIKLTPLAVFQNDRGDQVQIYQIHPKKIKR